MWNLLRHILIAIAGLVICSSAAGDQIIYSHQFDQWASYDPGSAQFDDWLTFRASLPVSGVTSITVSGSRDSTGRTCSDPVKAQHIADAMFLGAVDQTNGTRTLGVSCDGHNWNTGACSAVLSPENNLELNVGPGTTVCGCGTGNHTLRPGIAGSGGSNINWGGIGGDTCSARTQTMTVTVEVSAGTDPDTDAFAPRLPRPLQ
jgi:hypothetical protein